MLTLEEFSKYCLDKKTGKSIDFTGFPLLLIRYVDWCNINGMKPFDSLNYINTEAWELYSTK